MNERKNYEKVSYRDVNILLCVLCTIGITITPNNGKGKLGSIEKKRKDRMEDVKIPEAKMFPTKIEDIYVENNINVNAGAAATAETF